MSIATYFVIGVEPYIICQANNRWCQNSEIWSCNQYGTTTNLIENCEPQECAQSGNQAYCKEKSYPIGLIIGLVIGLFIGIILTIILRRKSQLKNK
jgi:hypothetical protein